MLRLFHRGGMIPRRCTWEITLACNLRCGHCGSRAGKARDDELDHAEALRVADELAALGCQHVTLGGGEPTLRADWVGPLAHFRERGVRASMISNGLTWSREHTAQAREAGIHRIGFSLDGLERTHNCVRRANQGYASVLRAIDLSVEGGLDVVAVTHVTRHNLAELEALHALLARHGVSAWQVQLGVPSGNLSEDRASVIDGKELCALIPRLARLRQSGVRPETIPADQLSGMRPGICAAFQEAVVCSLVRTTQRAAAMHGLGTVICSGGVAANEALRGRLQHAFGDRVLLPSPAYCTDNAAMIARAGYERHARGLDRLPSMSPSRELTTAYFPPSPTIASA